MDATREAATLLNNVLSADFPTLDLYDHQREAIINRLAHGQQTGDFSTLLAGDVGTGKTPFYLVYLRCVREWYRRQGREEESLRPSLAIVPAQIKEQWRNEAIRFSSLSALDYLIVDGNQAQRTAQLTVVPEALKGQLELLIINYALARRKAEQQLLQNLPFLGVVVDEAHRIKSRGAQQTVATKSIDCEFMVCGSGTHMTKGPQDLWSILHAMVPGEPFYRKGHIKHPKPTDDCQYLEDSWNQYLYDEFRKAKTGCKSCYRYRTGTCDAHTEGDEGVPIRYRYASPEFGSYERFTRRYCKVESIHVGRGKWISKITGARNLPQLRQRIEPWMVRWKKSEVLDLPPIYYRHVLLDFDPDGGQRRMYEELKAGFINQLSQDGYWTPTALTSALAQLTYIRRSLGLSPKAFYTHQQRKNGETPRWVKQALNLTAQDNTKVEWLAKWLKENVFEADAQALVFSQWTTVTREIRDQLAKAGYANRVGYATGEMSKKQNEATKAAFNNGTIDVVIGSPAISEGLNYQGCGKYIAYCIIMDCTWTPKTMIQTIGRLYRAEQASTVEVLFIGVTETFDQWMLARVKERQGWIQEVLDGDVEMGGVQLFEITSARQLISAL